MAGNVGLIKGFQYIHHEEAWDWTHKEPRATAKAKGICLRQAPEGIQRGCLRNPTTEMLKSLNIVPSAQ